MKIEEAVTSEAVTKPMVARYLRRTRMGSSLHVRLALLSRDFFGKRLHTRDATVSLDVAEQSCRAVPLAVPARIVVCVEQGAATAALQAECNSDEHLTHPPAGSEAPSCRLAGLTILELFGFSALWREGNVGWRDGTSIDLATRRLAGPP